MDPISSTLFILIFIIIIVGLIENYYHKKSLNSIPIRVHVNGTRGKSSVTRLIASGLREGNLKTSDEVAIEMKMTIKGQNIEHTISDKIKIE